MLQSVEINYSPVKTKLKSIKVSLRRRKTPIPALSLENTFFTYSLVYFSFLWEWPLFLGGLAHLAPQNSSSPPTPPHFLISQWVSTSLFPPDMQTVKSKERVKVFLSCWESVLAAWETGFAVSANGVPPWACDITASQWELPTSLGATV